jgi:hypothetical protein
MDIDKVAGRIHATQLAGQGKAKSDDTFALILDKATEAVHREAGAEDTPGSVTQVVRAVSCKVSHLERQTLQHASKVLDVLEEYARALENPQKSLKSIEPIVIRMQQELKGLNVGSMSYVGQHEQLAEVVNQIAVTASVEALKFQRGDYIS